MFDEVKVTLDFGPTDPIIHAIAGNCPFLQGVLHNFTEEPFRQELIFIVEITWGLIMVSLALVIYDLMIYPSD
jgi:hypothetical protein